jgi:hypothetical protein
LEQFNAEPGSYSKNPDGARLWSDQKYVGLELEYLI